MVNVTLEAAYREACQALGEATVRERLLTAEVERLTQQVEALSAPPAPTDPAP